MAQVIDNAKGFKVIEMSLPESVKAFGGVGVCDSCGRAAYTAYYIAVLNEAFCQYCYEEWQSWQSATKRMPRLSDTTLMLRKTCYV